MTGPIKILHVIDSLQVGGAERLLVDYLDEMQRTQPDAKHYICTLYRSNDELNVPKGIERIDAGATRWNFILAAFRINEFIKKNNIEIVHAHLVDSILFCRLFTASVIRKKIFSYHNFYFDKKFVYYSSWRKWTECFTYSKNCLSIYVSEEVKQCIESSRLSNGESVVLTNFPHPSFHYAYQYNETKELKAVIVANLRKTKNLELAVEGLVGLKDLPVSIDIYGEGDLRGMLEERIKSTNVKLNLKGRHVITSTLLSGYDVFLMTSESEGFPVSLLEAMVTGLPSILPDHLNVFREIAEHSSVFYSIKKPGDLSEKLRYVLENKKQLKEFSMHARDKAVVYTIEGYVTRLMEIYKSV